MSAGAARGPARGAGAARTTVRPARAAEAALLAALGARTFREAYGKHTPEADLEAYIASTYSARAQALELVAPDQACFLARRAREPIGFALLGSDEPAPACVPARDAAIQLKRIYVVQDAWGSGAGSLLLEACMAEARARGFETLWLTAWSENHRALAFYGRHRFVRVGTHPFRLGSLTFLDPVLARPV